MVGGHTFQVERQGTKGFFLLLPGQPVPREGAGLEQVSAVGRMLYLGQAQPAQEGTYTCECSNVAGNSSQDQQLEVHGELGWDDVSQAEGARRVGNQAPWQGRSHPQNLSQDRNRNMRTLPRCLLDYRRFINCPSQSAS